MPGTTSTGCLTPSIGRVRVIEKSCVKFWTISQRGGDAARLAVGRADWLGRPASGRVDRAWGDGSQVPQTRTPPRTPNARRTSMSWSAIGASPPRGSAWSCAGTATRSRVPARTSRSRRRLHARARARAYAQHAHSARLGPRCPPCSAVAGARHPMRWTPSAWSCVTPLPNGLRWMRVHGAGSAAVRRVAARCTPWPCHPAHSLQASPSALGFALWTGATAARGGTLATRWRLRALGRGLHFAVASAARRGVEWRGAAVASR